LEGDVAKRKIREIFELRPGQTVEEAVAELEALYDAMDAEREREAARAPLADPAPDSVQGSPLAPLPTALEARAPQDAAQLAGVDVALSPSK
jgi:hypothetical protein